MWDEDALSKMKEVSGYCMSSLLKIVNGHTDASIE